MRNGKFSPGARWRGVSPEAFLWLIVLAVPVFLNPASEYASFCPFKWLGFEHCPGCGLGRALIHLYHGDLVRSLESHRLAIPAVIVMVSRVVVLFAAGGSGQGMKMGTERADGPGNERMLGYE